MRRVQWIVLGIVAIIIIVVLYVFIAKPTLVLPTQTVHLPALAAYLKNMGVNQLDLRVRTDGNAYIIADGRELGRMTYTPQTLGKALQVASVFAIPESTARTLGLLPAVFPTWTSNLVLTGLAGYYVLPMEITFRFPRE